jgi:hypothetical protein
MVSRATTEDWKPLQIAPEDTRFDEGIPLISRAPRNPRAATGPRTLVAWGPRVRTTHAVIALAPLVLLCGCSVPDVTLVPDDASSGTVPDVPQVDVAEAAASGSDGGDESAPADGASGGGGDSASPDAPVGCPGNPPPGVTCCTSIECYGACTPAICTTCEKCNANQICCVKQQSATCHTAGQPCP